MMHEFIIQDNEYLGGKIYAFYHETYIKMGHPGHRSCITTLKNICNKRPEDELKPAVQDLKGVLLEDFPQIFEKLPIANLTVCVVPRSKAEYNYHRNQLLFKLTVRDVINQLDDFIDGTDYIIRHTDTRTTHVRKNRCGFDNNGDSPYLGITTNTCHISNDVKGSDILLVDDVYTKTVNIDEDAIQTLLNNRAKSVIFYSVGRTIDHPTYT